MRYVTSDNRNVLECFARAGERLETRLIEKRVMYTSTGIRRSYVGIKGITGWLQEWGWEPRRYKVTLLGLILIPAMAFPVALFFIGAKAIFFLLFSPVFALINAIVYGTVGSEVTKTRSGDSDDTDVADCIIVQGWLQSPGTAVLKDRTLLLRPIVGRNVIVNLDDITGVREVSYFNGHLYITKTGFWLDLPGAGRLGFALANSIVERWRPVLMNRMHGHREGSNGS